MTSERSVDVEEDDDEDGAKSHVRHYVSFGPILIYKNNEYYYINANFHLFMIENNFC